MSETWRERAAKEFERQKSTVGKGWHPLLEVTIHHIYQNCPNAVIEQVKEKFGGLRVYFDAGDMVGIPDDAQGFRSALAEGGVDLATSISECICEECGAPGHLRPGGWVKTRCDKCQGEYEDTRQSGGANEPAG